MDKIRAAVELKIEAKLAHIESSLVYEEDELLNGQLWNIDHFEKVFCTFLFRVFVCLHVHANFCLNPAAATSLVKLIGFVSTLQAISQLVAV